MWRISICLVSLLLIPFVAQGEVRQPMPVAKLSASSQAVTPQQFQVTLERQLRKQFPMENVDFSVDILFPKQPIVVPKGVVGIQIPPDTLNGRTGRRAFRSAVHVNSRFEQMVNLVAEISAHSQVVAPIHFIKAREVVTSEDIQIIDIALPALQHDFVQHMDFAIGKKTVRLLPPNLPIQQPYLVAPPVVHKGDRVVLEARRGGLLVQTVGIAKASGEPGKSIAVENKTSGREVIGRVVNAGLVEVLF